MIFSSNSKKHLVYLLKVTLLVSFVVPFLSTAQTNNPEIEQILNQLNGKTFWYYPTVGFPNYCRKNKISGAAFDYSVQLKFKFEYINPT